jgi:hypothetical protein
MRITKNPNTANILLEAGESCDIILPSGRVINVEVTQDTASVVTKDRVLFNEDREFGQHWVWEQTWPKPE